MFEGLSEDQLPGALEAMLFVTDEPVNPLTLAEMLEVEPAQVEQALDELAAQYEQQQRGIRLREVAGGWRFYTHSAYHNLLEQYVLSWDTRKLSQAAMETLAVVAYTQPTTRAGVASVRGVNSDSSINSLVEKGLLREAGQADVPGNPMLYATTRGFLEKFGLRSVADLPPLDAFAPDEKTQQLIRERLSATQQVLSPDGAGETELAAQGQLDELAGQMQLDGLTEPHEAAAGGHAGQSPDEGTQGAAEALSPSEAAQEMLAQAMAQSFGLVEKIDFDSLEFDTDDE